MKGLKEGPLQLSFSKKKPKDMTNLLSKVEKYINSEESLKFAASVKVPMHEPNSNKSIKQENDDDKLDWNNKRPQFVRKESKLPPLKYSNYTSLNTAHTSCRHFILSWPI